MHATEVVEELSDYLVASIGRARYTVCIMGTPALSRRVVLWEALFAPPLRGGRVFYWGLGHGGSGVLPRCAARSHSGGHSVRAGRSGCRALNDMDEPR